jgi:hypothetical protein
MLPEMVYYGLILLNKSRVFYFKISYYQINAMFNDIFKIDRSKELKFNFYEK